MAYAFRKRKSFFAGWVDEQGVPRRKRVPARTLTEARHLAEELEAQAWRVRTGLERSRPGDITIEEAIGLYLGSKGPEYKTLRTLRERLAHVSRAMGGKFVRHVVPADVMAMLAGLERLSPQTREHVRMAGQGLYTYLVEHAKRATENPFKETPQVKVPKRAVRYYEPDVLPKLLGQLKQRHRAVALFSLSTGARKGEVLGLRKAGVRLADRFIIVSESGHHDSTKGNRDRVVAIPELIVPIIEDQLKTPGPYLFPKPNGKRYPADWDLARVIARALVRAGYVAGWAPYCWRKSCGWKGKLAEKQGRATCPQCGRRVRWKPKPDSRRFKDLRSTWATYTYRATRDHRLVQQGLGHQDPRTTDRYTHLATEHLREGTNAGVTLLLGSAGSAGGVNPEDDRAEKGNAEKTQRARGG